MEYKYFTLDKNPKQFKRISIGEYSIELRIEWNTRSKAWYVLGYSGDEIVISNVKMTPNQLYSIDIDSEYDLPYMIGIVPKYTNHDWDTETTFLIVDNPLSNAVEGLTVDGGVIKRSIATSSDTHSRKALKGTENKYLFDVVSIPQETGITIVCNGADASFKTVNLPQGRWDFTINGLRTITANTEAFRSLMNDYGVQIVDVGNNEYLWTNNSNQEIKIEGLYPYAAGYDFNVVESSNESAKIHSVDNNGWVNRFTVCLVPASSLIWTITSGGVSSDYQYVNFTGEQSVFESTAKLSTTQALVEKYKNGIDPYSATIVNSLTGVSNWVLDPANNQIVYTDPNQSNPAVYPYLYSNSSFSGQKFPTVSALATYVVDQANQRWPHIGYALDSYTETNIRTRNGKQAPFSYQNWPVTKVANPAYDPSAEEEKKTLPLNVVAQQVTSNAESGNVDAQKVVLSAALSDILVESLYDDNMRQWQAVKDAAGGASGSWGDPSICEPEKIYKFRRDSDLGDFDTHLEVCRAVASKYNQTFVSLDFTKNGNPYGCNTKKSDGNSDYWMVNRSLAPNPNYSPTCEEKCPAGYEKDANGKCQPTPSVYKELADKIIVNSKSSDQGLQLLAQVYIDEAIKKFTNIDLVKGQFEANKQPK